jgi:hypothetical protein
MSHSITTVREKNFSPPSHCLSPTPSRRNWKVASGRAQGAQIKLRLNERGNITETVRSGTSWAHYRLSRRRRAS